MAATFSRMPTCRDPSCLPGVEDVREPGREREAVGAAARCYGEPFGWRADGRVSTASKR